MAAGHRLQAIAAPPDIAGGIRRASRAERHARRARRDRPRPIRAALAGHRPIARALADRRRPGGHRGPQRAGRRDAPGRTGRHDQVEIVRGARKTARDAAMTHDHTDDVLKDLEAALSVTPSPAFAEGVRARIRQESGRRRVWPAFLTVGLAAAAVLVILLA